MRSALPLSPCRKFLRRIPLHPPTPFVRFWRIGHPCPVSSTLCVRFARIGHQRYPQHVLVVFFLPNRSTKIRFARSGCRFHQNRTSQALIRGRGCPFRVNRTSRAPHPALGCPIRGKRTPCPPAAQTIARHADLAIRQSRCKLVDCLRAWRNGRRAVFRWQ